MDRVRYKRSLDAQRNMPRNPTTKGQRLLVEDHATSLMLHQEAARSVAILNNGQSIVGPSHSLPCHSRNLRPLLLVHTEANREAKAYCIGVATNIICKIRDIVLAHQATFAHVKPLSRFLFRGTSYGGLWNSLSDRRSERKQEAHL